jgi:predicted phage gp36 major capsid-like protein
MQDNSINLPQLLGRLLGERLGRITNTHFTTGTGTGQPNGVVTAATFTQATTGNATTITFANLVALYHSVDPAYRGNAKWMMNDNSHREDQAARRLAGSAAVDPGPRQRAPGHDSWARHTSSIRTWRR